MAALVLESLVLRGSVQLDVVANGLRLGFGTGSTTKTAGSGNSMRNPRPGCQRPDEPAACHDVVDSTSGAMPGAGRSLRLSGLVEAYPGTMCWQLPATRTPPAASRGQV